MNPSTATSVTTKLIAILTLLPLLFGTITVRPVASAPNGPHCGGVGPLPLPTDDPEICGCTWGSIYYRGQPIALPATLNFNDQQTPVYIDASGREEAMTIYRISGHWFEPKAKRGDIMSVRTEFAGQHIERVFRAWPEETGSNKGEQFVPIVVPEEGTWEPWISGGYTRTLTVENGTLWAGGPAGLLAIELATGTQTVTALPWPESAVVAFAVAPDGTRWAAGPHHLARFDGMAWIDEPTPFAATIHVLAIDPSSGALWVGGGDGRGSLARYDGTWQSATGIWETVRTLTFAHQPTASATTDLWVGTSGRGIYRQQGGLLEPSTLWQRYTVNDGLASNYLLAATSDEQAIWFGTGSYFADGALGGISRYDLATGSWQQYSVAQGLPTSAEDSRKPANIYALALDQAGTPWSGSASGVQLLASTTTWVTDTATTSTVSALVTVGDLVIAATDDGMIHRLDRSITPGQPPTATITTVGERTLTTAETLEILATALDHDEGASTNEPQILAWNWVSDLDGPICTTADHCSLPAETLSPGTHTISLRVQDDEGVWSDAATTVVTIAQGATAPTATTQPTVTPQPTLTPSTTPSATPTPTASPTPNTSTEPTLIYLPVVQK